MWNFLASKNFQKILPDKTHKHTKSHLKKYFPNFRTQKNPGIENSNPKKSFDHPRHLKLGAPPLVPISSHLDWTSSINEGFIMWSKVDFLLWHQCGKNWGGRQAIRRKDSLIFCPLLDPAMMTKSPFSCLLPFFFFFFLLLSNFAPHSTIWMLVFLQGVRLVSSKQTPMYCKVNFQYKNIASKCLIWLSRVHFRKKKMSMIPDGYVFHPIASWCPYFQWVCHTDCTDQSDLKLSVYVVNPLLDGYEQGWNTCNWLSPSVISVLTDSSPYLHVIL